jgi:hypothetical protein
VVWRPKLAQGRSLKWERQRGGGKTRFGVQKTLTPLEWGSMMDRTNAI